MGLFKKLGSIFGANTKEDEKRSETSALEKIRGLKRELGIDRDTEEEENLKKGMLEEDEYVEEKEGLVENDKYLKDDENEADDEDEENDDEEEEEDEELAENRAKPIFIVRLKRFGAPLTSRSLLSHKEELASYGSDCILMRDDESDTYRATCFFGKPTEHLMSQAIETLDEWIEDEEEKIVPVVDILTGIECHNCEIDRATLRKVAYYIVNAYGEETDDIMEHFPFEDSLVRIVRDVDGNKTVKDFLVYPDWAGMDEDSDGWVEKMISRHGIML